jgi:hypothetical protein
MKLKYESRKLNAELQIKKADIELMTQMKETKLQVGKELILFYVDTIKSII